MICAKNKILTIKGYVALGCLLQETELFYGKVHEIYFAQVESNKLKKISFMDAVGNKKTVTLDDNHEFISPEGNFKAGQANIGKKIFYYNCKTKRDEIRSICAITPFIRQETLFCVYPIITEDKYIVEGALLRNVGFQ